MKVSIALSQLVMALNQRLITKIDNNELASLNTEDTYSTLPFPHTRVNT